MKMSILSALKNITRILIVQLNLIFNLAVRKLCDLKIFLKDVGDFLPKPKQIEVFR